jgi:hypothetical protein
MNLVILVVSGTVAAVLIFVMFCLLLDLVPRAEEKEPDRRGADSTEPRGALPALARSVTTLLHLRRVDGPR